MINITWKFQRLTGVWRNASKQKFDGKSRPASKLRIRIKSKSSIFWLELAKIAEASSYKSSRRNKAVWLRAGMIVAQWQWNLAALLFSNFKTILKTRPRLPALTDSYVYILSAYVSKHAFSVLLRLDTALYVSTLYLQLGKRLIGPLGPGRPILPGCCCTADTDSEILTWSLSQTYVYILGAYVSNNNDYVLLCLITSLYSSILFPLLVTAVKLTGRDALGPEATDTARLLLHGWHWLHDTRRIREMLLHQLGLQLGPRYNYKTFYGSHSSGPITASGDQKCWWWKHVGFLLLWEGMTCMEQSVECFCEKTVFKGELWSFCTIFSARKGDVDRNLNPREIQGPEKLRKACLQGIGSI